MNLYQEYLKEIAERKENGLHPKPIDGGQLLAEIIAKSRILPTSTGKILSTSLSTTLSLAPPLQQSRKQTS